MSLLAGLSNTARGLALWFLIVADASEEEDEEWGVHVWRVLGMGLGCAREVECGGAGVFTSKRPAAAVAC